MKNSAAKKAAYIGVFVALAFVFSYIEVLLPFSIGIYGVKLGLANIVVLTALYTFGIKESLAISVLRMILVGFTFSNMSMLLYSMVGGLLSWLFMCICKSTKKFSIVGVSVAGGITHNIGQVVVAMLLLGHISLLYYLPVLLVAGTITGLFIGIASSFILKIKVT